MARPPHTQHQRAAPSTRTQAVRFEDLPEVLTPKDVMTYLPIGRDAVYQALHAQTIRNVRIGQKFIIPKAALRDFLAGGVE